ncbi:MAG TPA: hypothetical protein VGO56_07885 [Pyrinomonadaceae bacterium]|jgi:hypothetical protein|nr:hypothetical protein [Pyrinomonadaceae bacterium]
MKKILLAGRYRMLLVVCALAVVSLPLLTSAPPAALAVDKMSAEDVVAKHLESIGTAEARSSLKSRIVVGTSHVNFSARNNIGTIDGRVVLGSIEHKELLAMSFPSPNYPSEKFGFDGKKFTVGYLKPGVRSTLGSFILIHDIIFKEGLMGGALTSAWPLLNLAEHSAKLEYAGTSKIGDRLVHKLEYSPKKGSDLTIILYFDAQTFAHVRTQYERVVGAKLSTGGIDSQAGERATRYKMIEDFSDFKSEGGLNLPHNYKLELNIEGTTGSSTHKFEMILSEFMFSQDIDEAGFNVEAN